MVHHGPHLNLALDLLTLQDRTAEQPHQLDAVALGSHYLMSWLRASPGARRLDFPGSHSGDLLSRNDITIVMSFTQPRHRDTMVPDEACSHDRWMFHLQCYDRLTNCRW